MQSLKSIFTNALIALGSLFGLTLSAAATDFTKTEDLANQGYVNSQFSLGAMYEQGVGVDKDLFQAFKWYKKAADQGHSDAQNNLGNSYYYGHGVRQDHTQAFKWYKKAADQVNGLGLFNTAQGYYYGEGVRQNKSQAKELFGQACDNGNQKGCDMYRKMNEHVIGEKI